MAYLKACSGVRVTVRFFSALKLPTLTTKREGLTPTWQGERRTRKGFTETLAAQSPGAVICSSNAAVKPLPEVKFSRRSLHTKVLGKALHSGSFWCMVGNADTYKSKTSMRSVSALRPPFTPEPKVHCRVTTVQGACGSSRASQNISAKMARHRSVLRQAAFCQEPLLFPSRAAGLCEILPVEGEPHDANAPAKAHIFFAPLSIFWQAMKTSFGCLLK